MDLGPMGEEGQEHAGWLHIGRVGFSEIWRLIAATFSLKSLNVS